MRGYRLSVNESKKVGVFFAACRESIEIELFCEFVAKTHSFLAVCHRLVDGGNDVLSVLIPIGGKMLSEVVDRFYIVVCEYSRGLNTLRESCRRGYKASVLMRDLFIFAELTAENTHIEVSPVDSRVVAVAREHLLLRGTDLP